MSELETGPESGAVEVSDPSDAAPEVEVSADPAPENTASEPDAAEASDDASASLPQPVR